MNETTRLPATLQSVADAVGVHRSTASRALNPATAHLSPPEVVERVQAAARTLGYRRDVLAAGLADEAVPPRSASRFPTWPTLSLPRS